MSEDCFVRVEPAEALVGAQSADPGGSGYDPQATATELTPRKVVVAPFWIMRHEATAGFFARCVAAGACRWDAVEREGPLSNFSDPGRRDHPANLVTWEGARAACRWAGGRLPTDVEWEVAARGTSGLRFPWGEEPGCGLPAQAVTEEQRLVGAAARADMMRPPCAASGTVATTRTVGVSPFDVAGMGGNVWEWTDGPVEDGSGMRPQRGGGWMSVDAADLRASSRLLAAPELKLPDVGFRCVWGAEGGS